MDASKSLSLFIREKCIEINGQNAEALISSTHALRAFRSEYGESSVAERALAEFGAISREAGRAEGAFETLRKVLELIEEWEKDCGHGGGAASQILN